VLTIEASRLAHNGRDWQPLGVEAAVKAIEADDGRPQIELALQQARYESNRAQQQCDLVDPANRIVAAELERRGNERLW
jgi:hypothetical protein